MRGVRREVLRLIITFVEHSEDPRTVCEHLVPPLLDPVLGDYQRSIPNCRDHEVLHLMATMVNKLKSAVRDRVPAILEAVFQCTLEMITVNFEDYPEHRLQFYAVLEAVNKHCFQVAHHLGRIFNMQQRNCHSIQNSLFPHACFV